MNKKEIARIKKEEEEMKKKEKNNELDNDLRKLQKEKKEEEKRKIEEEKKKKEMEEMRKKEIKELNKKKKEEEKSKKKIETEKEKIKEDLNLKENSQIEIQKLKEDLNPKLKEEKTEKEIKKIKELINKKKEEEKKQEKEKEKSSPKQIIKLKIKEDKNVKNEKKNEEKDGMNELKNSILNSSRLNKYSRPTSVHSRRSVTPETHAKRLSDIYNFTFFTGHIKDFITAYNHYFKSIPEIQKSVFNCKLNIIESINLFYTPKIIICTDKKNILLIKGICIFGFEFDNNIIKVIISHISSYNDIERDNIISYLILFIKQHIECDEIIINLYYQYHEETNKFNLDNEIRDLFKNNLMLKLENVDNKTRFQKMSLKIDKDEILETIGNNYMTMQKLFEINYNVIFSIKENEKNGDSNVNYDKFVNMFSVVFLYKKLKNDSFSFSNFEEKYKEIFENEIKFEEMDIDNIINFKMNENDIESFYIKK